MKMFILIKQDFEKSTFGKQLLVLPRCAYDTTTSKMEISKSSKFR